jgi:hypothetical protein
MEVAGKSTKFVVLALLFPFAACWVQWHFRAVFKPFVWFLFFPAVFFSSCINGPGRYCQVSGSVLGGLPTVRDTLSGLANSAGKRLQTCHSNHS